MKETWNERSMSFFFYVLSQSLSFYVMILIYSLAETASVIVKKKI